MCVCAVSYTHLDVYKRQAFIEYGQTYENYIPIMNAIAFLRILGKENRNDATTIVLARYTLPQVLLFF